MSSASFVRHFVHCNRHDLSRFMPLLIGGKRYGYVKREHAVLLPAATGWFREDGQTLVLEPKSEDFTGRSEAFAQATQWLCQYYAKTLRHEMYPVFENWGDEPLAQIDRSAVPYFGVRAWGLHVNGFVRKADGIHLWVGERAADRLADPGKLDNMIGGGQPINLSFEDNLCKEAWEEAGVPRELALTAVRSHPISYIYERPHGLSVDTLEIYDLELPEDFIPQNTDGEVAAFHLMPVAEVADIVAGTDRFKFNCNLVVIDFLLRYKFIVDTHDEYAELTHRLNDRLNG